MLVKIGNSIHFLSAEKYRIWVAFTTFPNSAFFSEIFAGSIAERYLWLIKIQ